MARNKMLAYVVLGAVMCLAANASGQLVPANRPPPPPPPPPEIRFAGSEAAGVPGQLRAQLIPVAPQRSAKSAPRTAQHDTRVVQPVLRRAQPEPTATQPVLRTVQPVSRAAQPVPRVKQPVLTTAPPVPTEARSTLRTTQPTFRAAQPSSRRSINTHPAVSQGFRQLSHQSPHTQTDARLAQTQVPLFAPQGSITSHPAVSQSGRSPTTRANTGAQRQIQNHSVPTQRTIQPPPGLYQSQRLIQTQRNPSGRSRQPLATNTQLQSTIPP